MQKGNRRQSVGRLQRHGRVTIVLLWSILVVCPAFAQQAPTPVVVGHAEIASAAEELALTGTATARRISAISPQAEGLVDEVLVDLGDEVTEGQVMARLDPVIARHELATAAAALDQGQAELSDAERRRDEAARVHADNLIAASAYESAVAEADIAAAAVSRLEAEYQRQAEIVARHTVRAPFPGVVSQKLVEVGQWVQSSEAVFELVDAGVLRIDVPVPQSRFARIEAGTPAVVRFDSEIDDPIEAVVTTRVPISDPAARTFLARIEIDNGAGRYAPGMSARVTLRPENGDNGGVLNVPRDALVRRKDGAHDLWIVVGNGSDTTVRPVTVEVQRFIGNRAVIDRGEVEAGTRVVIRGNESLRPDQAVRVVEPAS